MNRTPKRSIRLYTYTMSPFAAKVRCFLLYPALGRVGSRSAPAAACRRSGARAAAGFDTWVTERLIPGSFRSYSGPGVERFLNAWKRAHLGDGPFLGGRDDIQERPAPMEWLARMRP